MISTAMKFKLLTIAAKYDVEIVHFSPGNAVVRINAWRQIENELVNLLADLQTDPNIINIIWDEGIVRISYKDDALDNPSVINRWMQLFEQYSF